MPGYGVLAVRLFLGPLLLLSGATKLTRGGFRSAVLEYRVLPDKLATLYATATPWLELLTAFALIAGVIVRVAAIAATALFVSFGGGIAVNLWRGRNLDCHCFGQMYSETLSVMSLVRVAVLAIGSVMLAVSSPLLSLRATAQRCVKQSSPRPLRHWHWRRTSYPGPPFRPRRLFGCSGRPGRLSVRGNKA